MSESETVQSGPLWVPRMGRLVPTPDGSRVVALMAAVTGRCQIFTTPIRDGKLEI